MTQPDLAGIPVLVTGGAGFIGSHLVDRLLAAGAAVRVLDDFSTGRAENLAEAEDRIELVRGDLRDLAACRRACRGVRYVFHQAALGSVPRSFADPAATLGVNTGGTANLFTAAHEAGVARVVYASSSSVYGDSPALPKREGQEGLPLSPYAQSKALGEQLAGMFARCFGLQSIGLRYFNVYGPRQDPDGPYAAVIPRFFRACLAGAAPVVHGDGAQSRDFTYVSDVVAANLLAAGAPAEACGRAYNVAAGQRITVLELAETICRLAGAVGGEGNEAPAPLFAPARPGDVRHSLADLGDIRRALGYAPQVALAEGLKRCLEMGTYGSPPGLAATAGTSAAATPPA